MALLEMRSISKNFGAIQALDGVDLRIDPGEVLGLMGDNGAGKSTLVKIVAGNFAPSSGGQPQRASAGDPRGSGRHLRRDASGRTADRTERLDRGRRLRAVHR